jgi:hypothetical protein
MKADAVMEPDMNPEEINDDPIRGLFETWERESWTPQREARVRGRCMDRARESRRESPPVALLIAAATFLGASSFAAVALLLANAAAGAALTAASRGTF